MHKFIFFKGHPTLWGVPCTFIHSLWWPFALLFSCLTTLNILSHLGSIPVLVYIFIFLLKGWVRCHGESKILIDFFLCLFCFSKWGFIKILFVKVFYFLSPQVHLYLQLYWNMMGKWKLSVIVWSIYRPLCIP